ncbi:pilus assembly PilX family protein [Variovorax sp. AFSI2.2]|uniref:pilus assembly PilX family protein n=1 Tax=Variovorax sp. AFSI2.2 TaxID=3384160 RepID=UPI003EB9742D
MKTLFKIHGPARERGVVLLFCLIILVVLLAGGVAVMRSMDTSLVGAGNLAFKRDLVNQGELAIAKAMREFQASGALAATGATSSSLPGANYSAIQLVANAQGIPEVLLKKTTLTGPDVVGNTFAPTGTPISGSGGVTVRYVIDRMCNATGAFSTIGKSGCVYTPSTTETLGGDQSQLSTPGPSIPSPPIYRVSVRVDGPRDTQAFLQASFTKPE